MTNQSQTSEVNHQQEMERLWNSEEYRILERQISQNNAKFADLAPSVKLTAAYLLKAGLHDQLADLWRLFFNRRIPTITEFLTSRVLGDANNTLYPAWRKNLLEIFAPGSKTFELIFTGAIGIGKSYAAMIAHMYNVVCITSLIEPQLTLGAGPHTHLLGQMFSVTLDKGELSIMQPFAELLKECPDYFHKVEHEEDFNDFRGSEVTPYVFGRDKMSLYFRFPNNIILKTGSNVQHAVAFSLFSAMVDEAELYGSLGQAMAIYNALKKRIESRFLGSQYVLLSLISSAATVSGVISTYVKTIPQDSPRTKVMSYPIWEVKSFSAYNQGYFYVMRGTKTHPSKILSEQERFEHEKGALFIPANCKVMKVPLVYEHDFRTSIEGALQEIAGESTLRDNTPFDDTSKIEDPLLVPEFNLEAPLGSPIRLHTKLPPALFRDTLDGKRLKRYPQAQRYLHLDLAVVHEAGLCMVHKEKAPDGLSTVFVADMVCWINSPTRIDLNAIKQLVIDLRQVYGVPLHTVSADQYQSEGTRQELEVQGVAEEIEYVSVIKTHLPYMNLASINAAGLFKAGTCPKLREQLERIVIDDTSSDIKGKAKVRSIDGSHTGDLSDGACGAVLTASQNVMDVPIYVYSHYRSESTSAEVSLEGYTSVL